MKNKKTNTHRLQTHIHIGGNVKVRILNEKKKTLFIDCLSSDRPIRDSDK